MKVGDTVKIINERYTGKLAGKIAKVIQIDYLNENKTVGIVYLKLANGRIDSINLDHVELESKSNKNELILFNN